MIPLQMELGGKDVCIVCADADLALAAQNIVKGGFSYSGQRCTAVKIVCVMEQVRGEGGQAVRGEGEQVECVMGGSRRSVMAVRGGGGEAECVCVGGQAVRGGGGQEQAHCWSAGVLQLVYFSQ